MIFPFSFLLFVLYSPCLKKHTHEGMNHAMTMFETDTVASTKKLKQWSMGNGRLLWMLHAKRLVRHGGPYFSTLFTVPTMKRPEPQIIWLMP